MNNKVRALKSNKLKVLGEICSGQNVTRTEIASAIGMTPMSISTIVKELMEEDILVEAEGKKKETACGRKPAILELSPLCPAVLALNLSRRTLQLAVMSLRADVMKEYHRDVPVFSSSDDVRAFIFDSIDEVMKGMKVRIAGIGFSTFGPVNTERGVILDPIRFNDVGDIELKRPLEERYGIPCVMIHDATASALAEHRLGHSETSSLIYLIITNGLGCGLVINNSIFGGENGLAGELGHITITRKSGEIEHLDSYVNVNAIADEINRAHSFMPRLSWHDIVALFNSEQEMFRPDFEEFTGHIAHAITAIADLLDISTFVLEYDGQECGDAIEKMLTEKVRAQMSAPEEKELRVLKSTYGPLSGVIGACSAVVSDIVSGKIDIDL